MGLLYAFPVSRDEEDFAVVKDEKLILKTYGLPYIFWVYAFSCILVVGFMFLAIKSPVLKLIELGDDTDALLGYGLLSFVGLLPVVILSFFFYEKRITKWKNTLGIEHRLFGIPVFTEKFELEASDELRVLPFIDSPNVAKIKNDSDSMGFQNKGYFVLWLISSKGKRIQLDRHSRKIDLDKLKTLITEHN
jgi:hypothetical protein